VKQAAGLNLFVLILVWQGAWKLKTKPADMFMMQGAKTAASIICSKHTMLLFKIQE
jgi:hypothetical protein